MLFVIMFIKIRLNYINLKILMFTYMYAISPIQSRGDMRGVWFHVLCDVLRTHSTFRAADSLSDKDTQYGYVDRA